MTASRMELLDRTRALAPEIAARGLETEAARKPLDKNIQELIDAELMELLVPKRWGGHELDLMTHVEVIEILAEACLSTAWIAAFYMGHNLMVCRFDERAQAEVFADRPFGLIPAATAPTFQISKVSGGWEVTGHASWGSGIMHADWVIVAGRAKGAEPHVFLVPVDDVEVHDVWHMSGMSGTGSNDFTLDHVFVPDHRAVSAAGFGTGESAGTALHGHNPMYRLPLLPFIYNEVIGLFSGGVRGAASALDTTLANRVRGHSGQVDREAQYVHVTLGEAWIQAHVAERLARDIVRQTEQCMHGDGFTLDDRLRLKALTGFVIDHTRRAVNTMTHEGGSTNFRTEAPLQRHFRDLNMLATHAFWDWPAARELYGRHHLGLEPNHRLI